MTDLHGTPADHAAILGWTNRTYTPDEIAAWNTYRNTPPNDEWAGMDNREPRNDMSTFAAGMRAARTSPGYDDDEMARTHLKDAETITNTTLADQHRQLAHIYSNLALATALLARGL